MIGDYDFTDIYVSRDGAFLAGPGLDQNPIPAPDSLKDWFEHLFEVCHQRAQQSRSPEFRLKHEGMNFRASLLEAEQGPVYVLRKLPDRIPDIHSLTIRDFYIDSLSQPDLNGLIVIAGAFGSGKTTTCSSLIVERLRQHGGVCVALEDPPEMPLEGKHGDGVCYQTWVKEGGFASATRQAARWAPDVIYIGEIRDAETAMEALKASINGRLIVATVHANSVSMAAERLFTLAKSAGGDADDISGLLASGLACLYHQSLKRTSTDVYPEIEFLWCKDEHSVGSLIKKRDFRALGDEVTIQRNQMMRMARK
jgi:twitching motility protein PilT